MLRQAVQTLTGRGDDRSEEAEMDTHLFELGNRPIESQTDPEQDAPQDEQDAPNPLQAQVERLQQNFQTLEQRLAAKDRYIGQLEGENRTLRAGPPNPAAGGAPEPQSEPDPVLDQDTASLFAEKYKEDPGAAMVALAEHLDRRNQRRVSDELKDRDSKANQAAYNQAVEQNVLRQVGLALQNYGAAAQQVVGDFVQLVQAGNASAQQFAGTWLGQQLGSDLAIAESSQGVYRLIEAEVLRRNAQAANDPEAEAPQHTPRPAQTGAIARPASPNRNVETPSDGTSEPPIEDRIGDAIVDAARGEDAQIRQLFEG